MAVAQTRSAHPFPHIGFTVAFNMCEQPAASINCGYDSDGLPIGLQIIGRRFDDLGVLQVARAFEAMRPATRGPGRSRRRPDDRIRAGAWRRCGAEGKHVKAPSPTFLVIFFATGRITDEKVHGPIHGHAADFERMMRESTPEQQKKGMQGWIKWMGDNQPSLVDGGAPLGKTSRVDAKGVSDTKNGIGGYSIVQADNAKPRRICSQGSSASPDPRRLDRGHRDHACSGSRRADRDGGLRMNWGREVRALVLAAGGRSDAAPARAEDCGHGPQGFSGGSPPSSGSR